MKIKNQLLITMSVIVISSLAIPTFFIINTLIESEKQQVIEHLEDYNFHIMDKISRTLAERVSDIKQLSDPSSIINDPSKSMEAKVDYLRVLESSSKSYLSIAIYDENGIRIENTRNTDIGIDKSEEMFFKNAISGKIHYDELPVFEKDLNQNVIHFSGPIYDSNKISGVIDLVFPTYKLNEIINGAISKDEFKISIDLISSENIVIFSNYDRDSIMTKSNNYGYDFLDLKESHSTLINESDFDSEMILAHSTDLQYYDYKPQGWQLISTVKTSDAFNEIYELQNFLYLLSFVFLAITVGLILIFSKSIYMPITKLNDATEQISNGNLDVKLELKGAKEFNNLSSSFNKMAKSLQVSKEEIKKLDKSKSEFISMISHELKNPLVPIIGYCDALSQSSYLGELNEKQKHAINVILKNSLQLENLTSDLLDTQRLELGQLSFSKNEISVEKIINDVYEEHIDFLSSKEIEFKKRIQSKAQIVVDKNRLSQIFSNLILNSSDFVENKNPLIEIGVFDDDSCVVFYVRDNGKGIPKEKQENLFQKFYQIETSLTRNHGGSGLGLVICKGILDACGGRIWCESEISKGTTFYFAIPKGELK